MGKHPQIELHMHLQGVCTGLALAVIASPKTTATIS
jgi:hypothetical protein